MHSPLYTIPANAAFTDTLAHFILEQYGDDPLVLSSVLILLPTRRSCVSLREAFLRASKGKPLLLPRMQPIGDVDENRVFASLLSEMPEPVNAFSEIKRLFILAKLVQAKNIPRLDYALRLAQELCHLLDELEREEIPAAHLLQLAPEAFAEHWQVTTEFLKILVEYLPAILQEQQIVSATGHRNQMLNHLAAEWKSSPPSHPVLVAGVTGSIPATAHLMQVIAQLPEGFIILPGYAEAENEYANESHFMQGMHKQVTSLKMPVEVIESQSYVPHCQHRLQLWLEILRSADTVDYRKAKTYDMGQALQHVKRVTCNNLQEEATVIALILRETLEHAGKTAALVTNDRALARRVSAVLQRFDVTVDDSGGIPLSQAPLGTFWRLIGEVAQTNMQDTVALLALLKHPLCCAGMSRLECLQAARAFEKEVAREHTAGSIMAATFFLQLEIMFSPLLNALQSEVCSLQDAAAAHLATAIALSTPDLLSGKEGEAMRELLDEMEHIGQHQSVKDSITYNEVVTLLLKTKTLRLEYGTHPRLKILSPIEARLQLYDVIVLGAMNEGSFPPEVHSSAWLNREMRSSVGLPSPEHTIALAAHDFLMLANAREIYFTRAEKVDGAPAQPSRWLAKLDVMLALHDLTIDDTYWLSLARQLDAAPHQPCLRPRPAPPLYARPTTYHVTQIEMLLRNPYALYARSILQLKPLKPLMRELDGADFGTIVHTAMEHFVNSYPEALPLDAYAVLLEYGNTALAASVANDWVRTSWELRFKRIAQYIIALETERRDSLVTILAERTGAMQLGAFTLKGRADRIEIHKDGTVSIIDYKTGSVASLQELETGLAPQLFLLAMLKYNHAAHTAILQQEKSIHSLEYWKLSGGKEAGNTKIIDKAKVPDYLETARTGVLQLLTHYADARFPYLPVPLPNRVKPNDDYAHLARVKEWG